MRKALSALLVLGIALPLGAAVPASRMKEPNAIFAYGVNLNTGRLQATLFDRAKKRQIDTFDAVVDFPLMSGGSVESNDNVQFSPATGKIYALAMNKGEIGGRSDESLPFDSAIVETDFRHKSEKVVFACDDCMLGNWIVHPDKPVLYVSVPDPYGDGSDPFRNAKLVKVTLSPKLRATVIARVPLGRLHITPDGKSLHTFQQSIGGEKPHGAVVTVNLSNRRRVQTIVHFPRTNDVGLPVFPTSNDVSPDAREMAYHFGIIDLRTEDVDIPIEDSPYAVDNYFIGWSRDSNKMLFQMMKKSSDPNERDEMPIVYDRKTGKEWILPIKDSHLLDWAPAQTAILFGKRGDVGFYDLEKRAWTFVAEGEDGAWVTLPTKRVPKR